MDITQLSAEERKALLAQLEKEQQEAKRKVTDERKAYKDLVNETVPTMFDLLQEASLALTRAKRAVLANLQGLVSMKQDVYEREDDQYTHTFTTDGSDFSITIGHRVNDGWDDTVHVGIGKVKDIVNSLGKDEDSKALVKALLRLLSRDAKGNLKASRVLQLKKLADDTQRPDLIEAIAIIQDAYRPTRSKQFVSARHKVAGGAVIDLPLSITDC